MNEEIKKKEEQIATQERMNLKYSKSRWYNSGVTNLEKLKRELEELKNQVLTDNKNK